MTMPVKRSPRRIVVSAVAVMVLGTAFLTTGKAEAAYFHRFTSSFTPVGSPTGVAVDQSTGEVYTASFNSNVVEAFEASGTPDPAHPMLTETDGATPYPFSNPFGVAVDNSGGPNKGDIYVADYGAYGGAALLQFGPSGVRSAQAPISASNVPPEGTAQSGDLPAVLNNGGFNPAGVAVGSSGEVYVSDLSNNVIDVFDPNGTFVSQFGSGTITGAYAMTFGSTGNLYVANGNGTIEFGASGVCVNSCIPVDPAGTLGVTTDPEGDVYADEGGKITELSPSGEPIQTLGEGKLAFGRGIAFNETSGSIYVADEGRGKVEVFEQFIAPVPGITAESASNVHSESAQLDAKVNPEGGDTTYHFEFGTDTSYGNSEPLPDASLGSGMTPQSVQLQLVGLTPSTTYHWRVIATNAASPLGGTAGPDHTFTTFPFFSKLNDQCSNSLSRQQTGAAQLLDCRSYEIASAANAGGYPVESNLPSEGEETPFGGYSQAESPPRVLYTVNHGAIPGTDHPTNKGGDPYIATRSSNGWSTEYVGIPATNPFAAAPFSSIPSGASATLDAFAFGSPGGCSPCFEGGYTGIPVHLPGGGLVQGMTGSLNPGPSAKPAGHIAKDLSANGEHFVFGSKSKFEADGNEGELSIYDHNLNTGETHVVSKTPTGATMKEEGEEIAELDVSANGSDVLIGKLTKEAEGAKLYHLYMNAGDSERTIDLTPRATGGVRFDGMTSDGEKVFFSSEEHLTGEDEQHSGADIFMWSKKGEEEGDPLFLISAGTEADASSCDPAANTLHKHWNTTGSQDCGDVAIGGGGGVASGDGTIYFLSPSLLDGSEEPADGVKNAPNLYVARPGQAPHFVATLESSLTGPLQSRHPFLRNFGSFTNPDFIATDASTEDLYAVDGAIGTIYKLNSEGEPQTSWRENGKLTVGGGIIGIATDPTNGDLYVDVSGEIREFSQSGTLLRTFGESFYARGIAVDASGNVYIYFDNEYYGVHEIAKFNSAGEYMGVVLPEVNVTAFTLDPSNGDLYVDNEGKTVERYSINGAGEATNPVIIASELSGAAGISVDSAHDVYIDEGTRVLEFNSSGEEVSVPFGAGLLHGFDCRCHRLCRGRLRRQSQPLRPRRVRSPPAEPQPEDRQPGGGRCGERTRNPSHRRLPGHPLGSIRCLRHHAATHWLRKWRLSGGLSLRCSR